MRFSVSNLAPARTPVDLMVFPVFRKQDAPDLGPLLAAVDSKQRRALREAVKSSGFGAKPENLLPVRIEGARAHWFLLVGMGPAKEVGLETIRRCAGVTGREARRMQAAKLAVALPGPRALNLDDAALARSWAEGAGMALSPVGELKTGKRNDRFPHRA